MVIKRVLSEEITSVFDYIKEFVARNNQQVIVDECVFVYAALQMKDSLAYHALSSIVMESTLEQMKEFFESQIKYTVGDNDSYSETASYTLFDSYIVECDDLCNMLHSQVITSSILLLSILKLHEEISQYFREFTVTSLQLSNSITRQISGLGNNANSKNIKKKKEESEMAQPIKVIENTQLMTGEIERSLLNITKMASLGRVGKVVCYDKFYQELYPILAKKYNNNAIIIGPRGVGKTSFVKNLANLINEGKCHDNFKDKILVEIDFSKLVVGTPFKGAFEQKFYSIINEAKASGRYIFFIDDIQGLLNENTKYAETDIESLLSILFDEPSIPVICTMTSIAYNYLSKNRQALSKRLQKVNIDPEEITDEELLEIVNTVKNEYEAFHNVKYTEEGISTCTKMAKKYLTHISYPESCINLLDYVGAQESLKSVEDPELLHLRQQLCDNINQIEQIKSSSLTKEYDKIDELYREQIAIKSSISIREKETLLSKAPIQIESQPFYDVISKKCDVNLDTLTVSEKTRLKGINSRLKERVIGQDEAVDEVCRVVKRQKIGLGEPERPAVLMFLGSTGTGKTYLAKQLAKIVYGDEKYFVRMDMSEYADKTSVNKICGSNPGYVGYEDGTFLAKALKQKKRFVLLLDEFEKSNEEVHNIFLQMFDEGRFTDNHGEEHSLKELIIILTSNVGAAEASMRGKAIGFNNSTYDMSREIIDKELKKKFKPEFLNRIQKIVYFNKLTDNNIRKIIELEVSKIEKKVEDKGYHLAENITKTLMIDDIYKTVTLKKEYGARPIVNEVQRRIEDAIVDHIIDNDLEEGHTFTYDELH